MRTLGSGLRATPTPGRRAGSFSYCQGGARAKRLLAAVFTTLACLAGCAAGTGASGRGDLETESAAPAPAVPPAERPVARIELVVEGGHGAYSERLDRLAFARFDPHVIGAPELSGKNDQTGTFQLWIADPDGANQRCLSCRQVPGGPRPNQHVGLPSWHPSGEWLIVAVEMPQHAAPHAKSHAGTGAYVDLWAVTPDSGRWVQLTRYANRALRTRFPDQPVGALVPRLNRRGDALVWAEMIGYDKRHPFGIWRLAVAEVVIDARGPRLENKRIFRPGTQQTTFYEAWSFSPDDRTVTVASDSGGVHFGYMDAQVWPIGSDSLTSLTRSAREYEEQAIFSPDGRSIAFMSTRGQSPRYDPSHDFWGTFRTDVWLMDAGGGNPRRLTYFSDPAYPEYIPGAVNRAIPVAWAPDGRSIFVDVNQNRGPQQLHESTRIYRVYLK